MNRKIFFTTFCCLISSAALFAQARHDKQLIQTTVETYFEGWATGDTVKLGSVLHASCHLKTYRDGTFHQVDRSTYLRYFQPQPRAEDVKTRIVNLDYTANVANVKTQITTRQYVFTDYLNLIKTKEGWVIVDKVACREDR